MKSEPHRRYVARHRCVVCLGGLIRDEGEVVSQAAHVKIGTKRAMSKKSGDETCVPLCYQHHLWQHAHGDEGQWWLFHGIDPLPIAAELWRRRTA